MNGPNYWKPKGSMNRSKSATLISLVGGEDYDGACGRSKLRPKKALADMEVGCKEDSTDGTYGKTQRTNHTKGRTLHNA
jgi:hypothetical protein